VGRIVNVGSASMYPGIAGQVHYVSAKAGLVGVTRSLAREVGEDAINVNLLTPGLTLTGPVVDHFPPKLIASQPEGRASGGTSTPTTWSARSSPSPRRTPSS
jgi:NAD(P)-dependent dehydrogenase (short-subunit alcohol dehydrogenase family)